MLSLFVGLLLVAGTGAQVTPGGNCICEFLLYRQYNCEGAAIKTPYPANFTAPAGKCIDGAIFDKTCHLTVYNESTSCNDGPKLPLPVNGCVEVPQTRPNQAVKSFKTVKCGEGPRPPPTPPAPYTECKCGLYQFNTTNCKGKPFGKGYSISGKPGVCLGRGAEFGPTCALEIHNSSSCAGPITTVLPDDGCTNFRNSLGFNASFYTKCAGGNAPPPPPAAKTCRCYITTYAAPNCTGSIGQRVPLSGKVNTCNNNVDFDTQCDPTLYVSTGCKTPILTLPPSGCANVPAKFSNPQIKSLRAYGCGIAALDEPEHVAQYLTGRNSWSLDNEIDF